PRLQVFSPAQAGGSSWMTSFIKDPPAARPMALRRRSGALAWGPRPGHQLSGYLLLWNMNSRMGVNLNPRSRWSGKFLDRSVWVLTSLFTSRAFGTPKTPSVRKPTDVFWVSFIVLGDRCPKNSSVEPFSER